MIDQADLFSLPDARAGWPAGAGGVRVVSKRAGGLPAEPGETTVHIDRTNPVLGNRHVLRDHDDPEQRARVIAAHRRDVERDIARGGPIDRELAALTRRVLGGERLALVCWCKMRRAPRECHGDLYVEEIERRIKTSVLTKEIDR